MYRKNNRFRGYRAPNRPTNNPRRFGKYLDPKLFIQAATASTATEIPIKHSFSDFDLPEVILKNLAARDYKTPTPIQDQALPYALQGQDVLGLAETGTGKTAVFLLPIIAKALAHPQQSALILAPTRELAMQIHQELKIFANHLPIYACLLIGGASINRQITDLRRHQHLFIGTPGRIKDLFSRRVLHFDSVKTVVLDEVDRMLDMGFIQDITQILSFLPTDKQTLLFSATLDQKVEAIAFKFMRSPIKIAVQVSKTSQNVDQSVIRVSGREAKLNTLRELLIKPEMSKVLIFGRTKFGVEKLCRDLVKLGFKAASIHGNKRQNQRENTIREFKSGQVPILIATDVASRGLDVKDITHVINFEPPGTYEDYIHRIGRTGRAGKPGHAITFVG